MKKKIYLLANAHIDPVWQWEWEEGAAEALSTFRIAADFCEQFDNFIFCHNEALLYKWVEEYDKELFEKIQKLVKEKKWHIMGGWQLQPDCNMSSGETFVRQIMTGRKYFLEKFDFVPTVAVNVDPFGHNRGLVQIMSKCGYKGYLFMRPHEEFLHLPENEFKWVGYDGSELTAVRTPSYNSAKGKATEKINEYIEKLGENDFNICLWGLGNHGGGPSREDLEAIDKLTEEMKEKGVEIIQSTPEEYIDVCEKNLDLPKVDFSLNPWAPGCYTSQVRIKQKFRNAENVYFLTESMCTRANTAGLMPYPKNELNEALQSILLVSFHDMLPGSSIQAAEEMGLRTLDHALDILSKLKARALFALASGQKKASPDKIPFFAYNPYPYSVTGDFWVEFMLWDQYWDSTFLAPTVFDEKGNVIPSQCEKERSTLPLEWRKRVVFHATLEPMKLNRFDCSFEIKDKRPIYELENNDTHYIFDCENSHIEISKKTGLVDVLEKDGKNYLNKNSFVLEVFDDDYDPWSMNSVKWTDKIGEFTLLSKEEAMEFCHTAEPIEAVHVIEKGDVRTVVEAVFGYKRSRAVARYIMSNDGTLQTDVRVEWLEKQKLLKYNIPTSFGRECVGEQAYGKENLKTDFTENVSQKYIAVCDEENALCVVNNGTYGSSYGNGDLKLTLMRSPSYCAHPIPGRVTMPTDRYMPHIEQGERDFSFKFIFGRKAEILNTAPRFAEHFNTEPMVLSFYPTGVGQLPEEGLRLEENGVIQLTSFKKAEYGEDTVVRLFNPVETSQKATLKYRDKKIELSFGKFEIKTVRFTDNGFEETDLLENMLD